MLNSKHKAYIVASILFIALVLQLPASLLFKHGDMRDVFVFLLQIGVVLALAAFIFNEANPWIGLFLAAALVSSFYPKYSSYSLQALYMVILGCIWYLIVVKWVEPGHINWLYNVMCVAVLLHMFFLILQYNNIDPLHGGKMSVMGHTEDVTTGILCNQNLASAFIAFGFPLFLRRYWVLITPLLIFGFIATLTTGGVVSVLAGLIFYVCVRSKKAWHVFVTITFSVVATGLFIKFAHFPSASQRWDVWMKAIIIHAQYPIMGMGLGQFKIVFSGLTEIPWEQLHNDILQGICEMGVSFPIILSGYLITTWERFRKVSRQAIIPMTALVIILINSQVNFPWHVARTAFFMVTILAILEIQLRECSQIERA